jgi:hypothetical protein
MQVVRLFATAVLAKIVEANYLMAFVEQFLNQITADEAGRTGN